MSATGNYKNWVTLFTLAGFLSSLPATVDAQSPARLPGFGAAASPPAISDGDRGKTLVQQTERALAQQNLPQAIASFKDAAGLLTMAPGLRADLDRLYQELLRRGVQAKDLVANVPARLQVPPLQPIQAPPSGEFILPRALSQPVPAAGQPGSAAQHGGARVTTPLVSAPKPNEPNPAISVDSPIQHRLLEAQRLVAIGRMALDRGDYKTAQRLGAYADSLQVADSLFRPGQIRPWQLMLDADAESRKAAVRNRGVVQAGAVMPLGSAPQTGAVRQGKYNPALDQSQVVQAQFTQPGNPSPGAIPPLSTAPTPAPATPGATPQNLPIVPAPGDPNLLYRQGVDALSAGNRARALELFREAWKFQDSLDPNTRQQLKDKLTLMRTPQNVGPIAVPGDAMDAVSQEQVAARARLTREVTSALANVETIKTSDPNRAIEELLALRRSVEGNTSVDEAARRQMKTIVDRNIAAQNNYIERNRAQIELDAENQRILDEINREQLDSLELDQKVSQLVEEFNVLMDERRFPEAEVIAKQVYEMKPDSPIATLLWHNARMGTRLEAAEEVRDAKELGFVDALHSVDYSSIPFDDRDPLQFGDAKDWSVMSTTRLDRERAANRRMGPREQAIQSQLKTEVEVQFDNRPLSEVIETLSRMTGVPMHIDDRALSAFNLTRDSMVSLNLNQPISLRSALLLLLSPLDLSYVIRNEVLMITSQEMQRSDVYPVTYRVASLVLPIPNFTTSYETGLAGAIQAAHAMANNRLNVNTVPVSLTGLANNTTPMSPTTMNPNVLAQQGMAPGAFGFGTGSAAPNNPSTHGGSMGGGAIADFDSLMDLIQTTIVPDTWEALGGPSTMSPYAANLSLVISTTSEVHDQISQLLASLRNLQNLQVTIEVRFISLADNFFERIGLSFNVEFDDNVGKLPQDDSGDAVIVGLGDAAGTPTADFDFQFNQGSFGASVPAFGGFDPGSAASIGFAILSDIEAFFFLEAAQGDSRTNVLQAPKVTLFDGQIASINDQSQRPFVISVTPIVGDFAVAQQPIIVVLNEGTALNVQAVVSDDRRFVRMTLVPFFSQIGQVDTFTFEGRSTTNNATRADTNGDGVIDENDDNTTAEQVNEGTTVQLPTFAFTSVSTTVSVPDGGTILLGGIKRLRETRSEQGVPILSKIPYINRLFKNVGTGRETNSLMLMVTPRIIIQEEEEMAQTGLSPSR